MAKRSGTLLLLAVLGGICSAVSSTGKVSIELLTPTPDEWTEFCVDGRGYADIAVRFVVRGARERVRDLSLVLLLNGKEHSSVSVAQDAAMLAAAAAEAPVRWPTRLCLAPSQQELGLMVRRADSAEVEAVSETASFFVDDAARCIPPEPQATAHHPRWRLPVAGSHLCHSEIVLQLSGVSDALRRYAGQLRLSVTVDGRSFNVDRMNLTEAMLLPSQCKAWFQGDAWHTAGFTLINTTARPPLHFIVYQHVVAFRVSSTPTCMTWQQSLHGEGAGQTGRHRSIELEGGQWRQGLRLLESLLVYPPTPSAWRPRGVPPDWFCREFSGTCFKNYIARQGESLLPLLDGPRKHVESVGAERTEVEEEQKEREEVGRRKHRTDVGWRSLSGLPIAGGVWRTLAERSKWQTYAPPVDHDSDVFELAVVANALLRHKAQEEMASSDMDGGSGGTAHRQFVMVELGAGFGRWSLEATALATRLDIIVRSICVEAEETHVRFLKDAFWEMGVPDSQLRLVVAAVGAADGVGFFPFGNARAWWGQSYRTPEQMRESGLPISSEYDMPSAADAPRADPAGGHGAAETSWHKVEVISLKTLLRDEGIVDLIHFDCQTAELDVIRSVAVPGEDLLDRVKMMFIGTHSMYIEHQILGLMCAAGWHLVASFPITRSPDRDDSDLHASFMLGRVAMGPVDGVQVWANPRHVDIEVEFGAPRVQGCFAKPFTYPIPVI